MTVAETLQEHRSWCHQIDAMCSDDGHDWSFHADVDARCTLDLAQLGRSEGKALIYVGLRQDFGDAAKVSIDVQVEDGGVFTIKVLPEQASALRDGLSVALDRLAHGSERSH